MTSVLDDHRSALKLALAINPDWSTYNPEISVNDTDLSYNLNRFAVCTKEITSAPFAVCTKEITPAPSPISTHSMNDNLTQQVLTIPFYEVKGCFEDNNQIRIGKILYNEKECGSSHENHTNLCFYMSVVSSNNLPAQTRGIRALKLKQNLAPLANRIRNKLTGDIIDFNRNNAMADTEVLMAMVKLKYTPICVANYDARSIVIYTNPEVSHPTIYVSLRSGHYTLLVPT